MTVFVYESVLRMHRMRKSCKRDQTLGRRREREEKKRVTKLLPNERKDDQTRYAQT